MRGPGKILIVIVGAILVLALAWLKTCDQGRSAKSEAALSRGQAGAAMQSGADAADAVGNRMDADARTDALTRENADAIRNAEGAAAPVAAPVRDAGLASLCRRAAYRDEPRCVQHAGSR